MNFTDSYYLNWLIKFIAAALLYLLYKLLKGKLLKNNSNVLTDINLPADYWFYSQLVDIELKNISSKKFFSIFIAYYQKKFHFKSSNPGRNFIFKQIEKYADGKQMLGFYKILYDEVILMKQKSEEEVIEYVKQIKHNFNKGDLKSWLNTHRRRSTC